LRAIALIMVIVAGLGIALRYPFAGVLLWAWFSLQNPHREAFGFAQSLPLNFVIAAVTLLAWLVSKEKKTPPQGVIFWLMILFLVWMTINSFFAFDPKWSWPYWDRTWKTFALGLILASMARTRVRIWATVWVAVLSLFYFGVKGGLFTIITGGHYHVLGPPETAITDNNALAVALLMSLPLANFLRVYCKQKSLSWLLFAGIGFTTVSVLGSYSRGAFIGLAALVVFGMARSRAKILYAVIAAVFATGAYYLMPAEFFDRVASIGDAAANKDASFSGRLTAWRVAFLYARDHFPFGAGFYGPQLKGIYNAYFPNESYHAAHSIYFQILGEHGFIGLLIYLVLLAAAFFQCSKIASCARAEPNSQWIADLAVAIQASLFVFCVAGAALSLAYYDLFIVEISLLLPLRTLVSRRTAPAWKASGTSFALQTENYAGSIPRTG
jgi:putative inorganic carbon (HCO3(-)) transporter